MVNQQLLDYIKSQLANNVSKEQIKGSLLGNGWEAADVDEGFAALTPPVMPRIITPTSPAPVFTSPAPVAAAPLQTPVQTVFQNPRINIRPAANLTNPAMLRPQPAMVQKKSGSFGKFLLILVIILILAGGGWFAFVHFNVMEKITGMITPANNQPVVQQPVAQAPAEVPSTPATPTPPAGPNITDVSPSGSSFSLNPHILVSWNETNAPDAAAAQLTLLGAGGEPLGTLSNSTTCTPDLADNISATKNSYNWNMKYICNSVKGLWQSKLVQPGNYKISVTLHSTDGKQTVYATSQSTAPFEITAN